ncbi:MAG: HDOD domain-containing protein [Desulfobacterales bacterium]|jgi:putative nucleotidyltransferase with HDIG domain
MAAASYDKPLLHGNALKIKLFKGLEDLMPMPQVILKAQMMLTDPNSSFEDLANVIETDPEITLQVLNVVNSAYYSLQKEVCSVRQACVMLGLKVIAEIIMAAGTSSLFKKALEAYNMNPKGLWQHSLATAIGSRKIANAVQPSLANEAFLAGLFHDVGKLILDEHIFSRNDAFKKFLGNSPDTHYMAEKQILGFDHSEIASELCKRWKFPQAVSKAIGRHHHLNPDNVDELTFILHAADNLNKIDGNGISGGCELYEIDEQVLQCLALEEDDINSILAEVSESVGQISDEIFGQA